MPPLPLAHETWLTEDRVGADWGFVTEGLTLALLALAVLVTLLVRVLARIRPGVDVPLLARMAPFMPFAVRLHLAVSLISLVSLGYYLSPAMDLEADLAGILLGAVMVIVAIAMAIGFKVRAAAWLLVVAGPLGMLEFGVSPVLQRVDMLGPAFFLLIAGAGRWSAEYEMGRVRDPSPEAIARAVWTLRVAAGLALIVVALVEKLAQPDLALAFLHEHPQFNVAREVGIGMSDLEFARVAGVIEVLFGLLLISGALPQAIVLIAGIPFNATLWFFGNLELVGHLPIYGTMLVLLVYGSDPRLRPLVSRAWPWRAAPG
ncbi:MAG TPA: hypothetical protein VF715_05635 [Thermoleophilaceae bacterium]